ncbi:GTP-binding protein EngA [Luminiphilus syltensis NOR5-1B]|uniref:GTPase Der n=1 Tax=Luminiphilus syltensis NOR5-1B TaxID=565045 RepID=B8KXH8_9GAMM|nr:ribosome biogenesis GTPase Der [Luminiphilus syltensis]EED35749.1 GTP-binding protein EngA [Luminiphilus syltensis NOR5-1B]
MVPVVALVGRPNVGKSTLFNQLTRTRDALVANLSGLTRDRQYGDGKVGAVPYIVIDTGGISGDESGIDAAMAGQSQTAIEEADIVLLMVDGRAGIQAGDEALVSYLRRKSKPFHLVINKIDGVGEEAALSDFYGFGIDGMHAIAASHNRGISSMMQSVLSDYSQGDESLERSDGGIRVAAIGRPNVGKSTLINRLLGDDRVVVFDEPGTTRDSIYIDFERRGQAYTLIDTAGVRRRKNVRETVEKFSIVKTLKAIADAHVVILLMDAHEGVVEQDLHLLGQCIDAGRGLVIAVNKWDGVDPDERDWIRSELQRRLQFVDYADIHFISALHGTGVGHLYESVGRAYSAAIKSLSTNRLTRILEDAVSTHPPPMVNGRRIKLRYAHAGGQNPPLIVIHGTQTEALPSSYSRYLEKVFRRELELHGTPVKIELRTGDNPFAGRRNKLTGRQVQRKRRLIAHVKKADKKRQNKKRR